jgi:hypothetical protein
MQLVVQFILGAVEDAPEILIEREEHSDLDYYIPAKKEIENAYQKGHPSWNLCQRRFKKKLTRDYKLPQEEAERIFWVLKGHSPAEVYNRI